MSSNSPRCRSLSVSRAIGSLPGESRESRAILHRQGTSVRPTVFRRHAAEGLENKGEKPLSLNKGLPNYDQMSAAMLGFRRRRTGTPRFSLIPSAAGAWQGRFCQKTCVTLLKQLVDEVHREFDAANANM